MKKSNKTLKKEIESIDLGDEKLEASINRIVQNHYNGNLNDKLELKKIVAKLLHINY